MPRTQFAYPPCSVNPTTELPYKTHRWIIKDTPRIKVSTDGEPVYYYRIVCKRCGLNDPKSPTR